MNIFNQFLKSLYSPKDIAKFRFQGIGKTIVFIFFLTLLSILPSIYAYTTSKYTGFNHSELTQIENVPTFVMILFIYIFSCGIKFIEVSILALIGLLLVKLLKRNVHYRQIWRMVAYSVTMPTLIFAFIALFRTSEPNSFIFMNWVISLIVLTLSIKEIPIKKQK